jgi:hypothetical protein
MFNDENVPSNMNRVFYIYIYIYIYIYKTQKRKKGKNYENII